MRTSTATLPPVYRVAGIHLIALLLCAAAVLAASPAALQQMVDVWRAREEFSHAPLIPIVAAFLVWQQKDWLERREFRGSWLGVAVCVAGAGVALVGQLATLYTLSQYGALLCVYGIVLAMVGREVFARLWAPLMILVFMIPLPNFILANLSAELQLLSSRIGVWLIRLFDISVYLEGNVIDLGVYRLQVAEACDGLRYLFPLMTLGFIMAHFFKAAMWKRVLLFLASIPVTVLMNSLRVGTIGIMVEHWGIGMAEGFLHEFQGWAVFMASAGVLLAGMVVLARIGADGRPWREVFGLEFPPPTPKDRPRVRRPVPASLWGACAVLVVAAFVSQALPARTEIVPRRTALVDFPLALGEWAGRRGALEAVYLDVLQLDDYLLADYRRGGESPVNFYIAWYNSQQSGRSAHSPRTCLPGGGWQMQDFGQVEVPGVAVGRQRLRVNRALIVLGSSRQLAYYWFQQRGRIITNEYLVKWYLFQDSLLRRRSDGALVRLTVPLVDGQEVAVADRQLAAFLREAVPRLAPYIPD